MRSSAGTTYTVRGGDWLARIADRHGISLSALLSANGLTATSLIHPQQLTIPGGPALPSPARSGGTSHTVKAGDWLSRIAERHGVSLSALLAANNLTAPSVILPGQNRRSRASPAGHLTRPRPPPEGRSIRCKQETRFELDRRPPLVTLDSLLDLNGLTVNSSTCPVSDWTLPKGAVASSPSTGTGVDRGGSLRPRPAGQAALVLHSWPNTFDCSGLTLAAYSQIGVTLVHHSARRRRGQGRAVNFWSEPIRAGDLIFLATEGAAGSTTSAWLSARRHGSRARRPGDVVRIALLLPKGIIIAVRRFVPAG